MDLREKILRKFFRKLKNPDCVLIERNREQAFVREKNPTSQEKPFMSSIL